jgi:RNA polymerase sigma-32 factor
MVAERIGITPEELGKMMQRLEARDVSLDAKVLDDSPVKLVDLLPAPDDQEKSLFEYQVGGSVQSAVAKAVSELDPRERYIAENRLMADPAEELSLAEIGRSLGVSRERARQLEARTKRKLRSRIPALGSAVVTEWIENSLVQQPAA